MKFGTPNLENNYFVHESLVIVGRMFLAKWAQAFRERFGLCSSTGGLIFAISWDSYQRIITHHMLSLEKMPLQIHS